MARTPQVTRTIQTTKVNVMCLNILEGNPFTQTVVLPRTYKDDKHILKAVEKVVNSESVKAVHVVDSVVEETLYGMTEQQFIELATVLPPRKNSNEGETDSTSINETATEDTDTNSTTDGDVSITSESEATDTATNDGSDTAEVEAISHYNSNKNHKRKH